MTQNRIPYLKQCYISQFQSQIFSSKNLHISRASVKRTYDVYYALRLPPDVQIELQRRTADFRNSFCPSEIDTRDVQKLSKGPPTFNQLYDVCPAYLPEIRCLCWLTSHFPLAGVLLTAVSSVAAPFWWLRDHCVYLSRVLSWLIDVFILLRPRKYSLKLYEVVIIF